MILKKFLIFVFVFTALSIVSQNKVCETSSEVSIMLALNSLEKCFFENKSKDNMKSIRNRYVRTKSNFNHLKGKLTTNELTETSKIAKKIEEENYVKFKHLTQPPVLLTTKGTSDYKRNLKEALKDFVDKNLVYPTDAKQNGIESTIWASFVIDTKGSIKNITTSGPMHAASLEKETERLIKALPNFIPGKYNGAYVNVKYLMTVDFKLDNTNSM